MTDLLTPPPEHDLPPERAADIRRVVMRSAAGTGRRRLRRSLWLLVPALTLLVVLAAVAGLRPGQTPSVLGSPSPAPSATSPGVTDDDPVDTDAGPLSEADAAGVVEKLHGRFSGSGDGELGVVVVSRRTSTDLGRGTFVVWTDSRGTTWWTGGIPGVMGRSGPVSGPGARKARVPDAAHPVVRLTTLTFSWFEDADRPDATARDLASGNFYLVSGTVDRVEVRMTVEGKRGPWFTAPVHDGYVFIPAVTPGPHSTSEHIDEVTTIEDRAFDHDGSPVPITAG